MTTQLKLSPHQAHPDDAPLGSAGAMLRFDDGLSPLRGIIAGALLSLPVWAGVGVVTWRVLR